MTTQDNVYSQKSLWSTLIFGQKINIFYPSLGNLKTHITIMYIDLRLFSAFQDLHRTGCSLFCGEDAHANQLMLKRVLLAYARWNKSIGYCQGFNMLAAIILEEST